ncbi:MAG: periplasmic heavy metal sensor [Bacteroidota bacterium]
MATKNTYRILIWVIVILVATNLSMGLSFWYHKQQDKKVAEQGEETAVEMPSQQRTRFFREQLNLNQEQLDIFRELNRDYNRAAWQITNDLEALRIEMIKEMGGENPDQKKLDSITKHIGEHHTNLKQLTIGYYMDMKEACDEDQQEKLNEIFISMSKTKEEVALPQQGRRGRGGYRYNNNTN